jgi:hypothetical protein
MEQDAASPIRNAQIAEALGAWAGGSARSGGESASGSSGADGSGGGAGGGGGGGSVPPALLITTKQ